VRNGTLVRRGVDGPCLNDVRLGTAAENFFASSVGKCAAPLCTIIRELKSTVASFGELASCCTTEGIRFIFVIPYLAVVLVRHTLRDNKYVPRDQLQCEIEIPPGYDYQRDEAHKRAPTVPDEAVTVV
jgi:hypothetical protein